MTDQPLNTRWLHVTCALMLSTNLPAASFVLDFDTMDDGTPLYDTSTYTTVASRENATVIDPDGNSVLNTLDSFTGSSRQINGRSIGNFWSGLGFTITGTGTLGLLDTHDLYSNYDGGGSVIPSEQDGNGHGDPDLVTGDTQEIIDWVNTHSGSPFPPSGGNTFVGNRPVGNALIFEETPGDSNPDDTGGGGTITFTIAANTVAELDRFVFLDDAKGSVSVDYRDPFLKDIVNAPFQ